MKLSDGFDARRLRNRDVPDWRWRWVCVGVALLILSGLTLTAFGALALFSSFEPVSELRASPPATLSVLLTGVLLTVSGLLLRRRSRRRRRHGGALSLAPHLLRKQG